MAKKTKQTKQVKTTMQREADKLVAAHKQDTLNSAEPMSKDPSEIYADLQQLHSRRYWNTVQAEYGRRDKLDLGEEFQRTIEARALAAMSVSAALDGHSDYEWSEVFESVGTEEASMLDAAAEWVKSNGRAEKLLRKAAELGRQMNGLVIEALEAYADADDEDDAGD